MTGYTEQDVVYNTLPLFHIGGQNMVWMALVSDTTVALAERFSASRFWQDVREYHATFTLFLGAMIPILHKQPSRHDDHVNPLRVALSAAPLGPFGRSSSGVLTSRLSSSTPRPKAASCSTLTPGQQGKLVPWARRVPVSR